MENYVKRYFFNYGWLQSLSEVEYLNNFLQGFMKIVMKKMEQLFAGMSIQVNCAMSLWKGKILMLRIFKQMDVRNRAYVVDGKGNKLFYGTVYQCGKFIEYMMEGSGQDGDAQDYIAGWKDRNKLDEKGKAFAESLV